MPTNSYPLLVLLNRSGKREAVLDNTFNVVITDEINGADTIKFDIPFKDEKRSLLDNEKYVQTRNGKYAVRTVTDSRAANGSVVTSVYAEAEFYSLAYSAEKADLEIDDKPAGYPMSYVLNGTGWNIGRITVPGTETFALSEKNALAALRTIQNEYGGDLVFNSAGHTVDLLDFYGSDCGAVFAYRKNLKTVTRVIDTTELITRVYVYGARGRTFAKINGGRPYVEDNTFCAETRCATFEYINVKKPERLLKYAKAKLAEYSVPKISYTLNAADLSALTDYAHETWSLGDIVLVHDEELGISVKARIIRREYRPYDPLNTVLQLSAILGDLAAEHGSLSSLSDKVSYLASSAVGEFVDLDKTSEIFNDYEDNTSKGKYHHVEGLENRIISNYGNACHAEGSSVRIGEYKEKYTLQTGTISQFYSDTATSAFTPEVENGSASYTIYRFSVYKYEDGSDVVREYISGSNYNSYTSVREDDAFSNFYAKYASYTPSGSPLLCVRKFDYSDIVCQMCGEYIRFYVTPDTFTVSNELDYNGNPRTYWTSWYKKSYFLSLHARHKIKMKPIVSDC